MFPRHRTSRSIWGDHVGDDPAAVDANRRRLAREIGVEPDHLVWMEQIHSRNVTVVTEPTDEVIPVTDALVTTVPGLALATLSADCVPVLLSDEEAGVIAAVHAGRIGARIGIVPRVLAEMVRQGADVSRIGAFLGPAASGRQYEVPAAMRADVEKHLPGSATRTEKGTPGLDLRAGLRKQLLAAGVSGVAEDPRVHDRGSRVVQSSPRISDRASSCSDLDGKRPQRRKPSRQKCARRKCG